MRFIFSVLVQAQTQTVLFFVFTLIFVAMTEFLEESQLATLAVLASVADTHDAGDTGESRALMHARWLKTGEEWRVVPPQYVRCALHIADRCCALRRREGERGTAAIAAVLLQHCELVDAIRWCAEGGENARRATSVLDEIMEGPRKLWGASAVSLFDDVAARLGVSPVAFAASRVMRHGERRHDSAAASPDLP